MIEQVPIHLSHKISQEAWEWMVKEGHTLYLRRNVLKEFGTSYDPIREWMIKGYWIISYFCNPSKENLDFMIKALHEYKMLNNNLEYLEFMEGLDRFVKKC